MIQSYHEYLRNARHLGRAFAYFPLSERSADELLRACRTTHVYFGVDCWNDTELELLRDLNTLYWFLL